MDKNKLASVYADIIITNGVNLRKGQCLLVNTGPGTYAFARELARSAYRKGAKFVRINVVDNHLTGYRIKYGEPDDWDWIPNYMIAESHQYLAEDWARVRVDSTEELDVLRGTSPEALGIMTGAQRKALRLQQDALMRDDHAWCVVAAPGPRWARHVMEQSGLGIEAAEMDDNEATEWLWEKLVPILRLEHPDPAAEWREHMARLGLRCKLFNELAFRTVRFKSEHTDLEIDLLPASRWRGGNGTLPDGRPFLANLPTEEVYTTPDWRSTRGIVHVTRPVTVMENQVKGAWFRFEAGRVTEWGAREGKEVLDRFLAMDEGACSVGEVALVAADSPIFKSGLLFGSILYDENASCHIALGAGYPSCLEGAAGLDSPGALREAGCNVSLVHTDFMIGDARTDVTGITPDGREVPVIVQGSFVI